MPRPTMGVVGCGRLGGLLLKHLSRDFRIKAYDERPMASRIRSLGAAPASLIEACAQEIVVLCVPISALEGLLKRIKTLLRPGTLVLDVASVKELPARWMRRWLPRSVDILATHPSFGPDSAAETLAGRKLVLCPVRLSARRYGRVKKYLRGRGLKLIETTPREHDRQAAVSLALTHFIGRGLLAFGAKPLPIDTEGYRRLLHILQTVQNDSWGLFTDMHRRNPFAAGARRRLLRALTGLDARMG